MAFVAAMSQVHFKDFVLVIANQNVVESRTVFLNARHLNLRILQSIEVVTPIGEKDNLAIGNMSYINDDKLARGVLEYHLDIVLADIECHIGCLIVECGTSCRRKDFTHDSMLDGRRMM